MHDVPLPCLTSYSLKEFYNAGVFPYAYDETNFKKGFYLKELSQAEKEKIKSILKDYKLSNPIE